MTIEQLQEYLPEYIDDKYPKGSSKRGKATVTIALFLAWIANKLNK